MARHSLALCLCLAMSSAQLAWAAPTQLQQQGRLVDTEGAPLNGIHVLRFSLFDDETGGGEVWTEQHSLDLEAGYYSVVLGSTSPLDDLLFDGTDLWLELEVNADTLSPRQVIVSVPYALRATAATHLDGGTVDASEVSVGGVPVIDSSGTWVGPTTSTSWNDLSDIPADLADGDQDTDVLGSLNCFEGDIVRWDATAGAWYCDYIAAGPAGADGPTGPQGPQGLTGADGPTGPQGLMGADGATGAAGPQGPERNTGVKGKTVAHGAARKK